MRGRVWFVGAGPGDPDLITVKGRRLLDEAGVIIYAGSLVSARLLEGLKAEIHDSASMTLDEVMSVMDRAVDAGKDVVRLHTGDPAIYGAIREQMDRLDTLGISYGVVPGVSSVFAVAGALRKEFTLPEVTQTVIITRRAGRTPVPESESLTELSRHRSTMLILLSVSQIDEVVKDLLAGGYPVGTPAHVVEKASWPEERIVSGTLADIAEKTKAAGISKTAIIAVGDALKDQPVEALSKLYDPEFTHGYRDAKQ